MLGDFITRLLVYVLFPTFPSFVHLSLVWKMPGISLYRGVDVEVNVG